VLRINYFLCLAILLVTTWKKERLRGHLINVYKYLKGGGRQMHEARLFSVVHSNRTRSNSLKLEYMKLSTSMRSNFFMVRSTETGCPLRLWIFLLWRYSRPTWTPTCAARCREPALAEGLASISRGPFQHLQFCDSVN